MYPLFASLSSIACLTSLLKTQTENRSAQPDSVGCNHNIVARFAWSPLDIFTRRLKHFPCGAACGAESWCASGCHDKCHCPDEWSWAPRLAETDGALGGLHGHALCGHATCSEQLITSRHRCNGRLQQLGFTRKKTQEWWQIDRFLGPFWFFFIVAWERPESTSYKFIRKK